MTNNLAEIRERWEKARDLHDHYDLGHWWYDEDRDIEAAMADVPTLLSRIAELEAERDRWVVDRNCWKFKAERYMAALEAEE